MSSGTGGRSTSQQEEEVQRVLRCKNAFEVFRLEPCKVEESELRRLYHRLALSLHPDKNPCEDAKVAFVRLASAFDQLRDPREQAALLLKLSRRKHAAGKPRGEATSTTTPTAPASASRPYNPRNFMDVLREWEEFEKEYGASMHDKEREAERAMRQEKKRSRQADRQEREQQERAALESVLEEDLEERSSSWSSFLQGRAKRKGSSGRGRRREAGVEGQPDDGAP